jgi:prophage DNA circulation protein
MSFRDNLLDASFRGANFKVMNSEHEVGRRTSIHQYANRDKPFVQDHGRDLDGFSLDVYIVQNIDNFYDYFTERDSLITALKQKGPGLLIHPFYGIKKVQVVDRVRISESFKEQGIAKFRITFMEAGERALPENILDFLTTIDDTVNRAFDLVGDYFYKSYNTVGAFLDVAQNALNRGIELVQLGIAGTQNIATKTVNQVIKNAASIKNLTGSILESPNDMYNAVKDVPSSFAIICGMGNLVEKEANSTSGTTKPDSNDITTSSRASNNFVNKLLIDEEVTGGEEGNFSGITRGEPTELDGDTVSNGIGISLLKQISDLIKNYDITVLGAIPDEQVYNVSLITGCWKFAVLAYACRVAARIEFSDRDELIEWMKIIADRIDEVLLEYGTEAGDGPYGIGIGLNSTDPVDNNDLFNSLKDIRNAFVEGMLQKASELAILIDYKVPTDVQNAIVLAYEKYEDIERYKEIYNNNKKNNNHPGFLISGDTIRILDE